MCSQQKITGNFHYGCKILRFSWFLFCGDCRRAVSANTLAGQISLIVAIMPGIITSSNSDLSRCCILKIYRFPALGTKAVVLAASLQEEGNVIPQKRSSAPGEALEGVALIAGAINSTPLQAASLGTFWAEPESTAPGRDPN